MTRIFLDDTVIFRGKLSVVTGPAGTTKQLVFDDGLPNYTYRVKRFEIQGTMDDGVATYDRFAAHLGTASSSAIWNLSNPNQIAWSFFGLEDQNEPESRYDLVDPTNIVVRDLHLRIWKFGAGDLDCNYFVELERFILDDTQAVVALANDVSTIT